MHHDARIEDIRNVGIIAHVDAGKTTTTERMLYFSGVTRHLGNVDHGDTVTDFLPLERERGITIQSAAISFHWPPQNRCPPGTSPKTINLIDTPGHQDFRFEVDRCLPVLDGAVCILDSVQGVEAHTERVWASAQDYSVPRIVYVNKLDRDGASFKKSVLDIASRLNAWPLVCQIPLWDKESLVGVVDVVRRIGLRWSSAGKCVALQEAALRNTPGLWEEIERARSKLVDKLCEDDDALVEEFAQGSDVSADSIKRSIRRAISSGDGKLVPIFAGSSLRNMGVEPLLDAIVDYLPHPQEGPGDSAVGSGDPKREANAKAGSKHRGGSGHQQQIGGVASVFKVVNDTKFFPDVHGMMTFVRVKEGTLYKNSLLTNLNLGPLEKPERPLNIMQVSASKVSHIPHIGPGQIGAIEGLKSARTGDTLVIWPSHSHAHRSPGWTWDRVQQRPLTIAPAVAFISIEPYRLSDVKGLEIALAELSREDPSLRWSKDEKTDTFVLSGMGKLHLEIAVDRLKTNYKSTGAIYGQIEVDYKECLVAPTGLHRYVYDRVVASKSGRAACTASLRPIDKHQRQELVSGDSRESNGNVFDIKLVGGTDSSTSDTALLSEQLFNGAYAAMFRGPRRGFPVHDCHVSLTFDLQTDYSGPGTDAHVVNAARYAVKAALDEAQAKNNVGILEPVMVVHIHAPEDSVGSIQHDISAARGGYILEVKGEHHVASDGPIDLSQIYAPPDPYETTKSLLKAKEGVTRMIELVAKVPLKEMLDYDSVLRSKTLGRHSFTMELDSFQRIVGAREKSFL